MAHFRVLLHLGRWTDASGMVVRSGTQKRHAADVGIGRQHFSETVSDLARWGYLEKVMGDGQLSYRVIMDPTQRDKERNAICMSPPGDTQEAESVSPTGDMSSADDMERVASGATLGVAYAATPYSDLSSRPQISPPTPQRKRRGARASVSAQILDEGGPHRHVVEIFVGPLYESKVRPTGIENAPAFLRSLRDGLGSEGFTVEDLQQAHKVLDKSRTVMPGLPECLKACRQAKAERRRAAIPNQAPQGAQCRRDPSVAARSQELQRRLRSRLGDEVFDAWFSDLECESFGEGALVLSVSVPFRRTWIGSHFQDHLQACCEATFPGLCRVEIVVRAPAREAAA